MISTARALHDFYSGFGIPAYTTQTVPDEAVEPYITYNLTEPDWNSPTTHYCQVWYNDTSNAAVLAKADEIVRAIGEGIKLHTDGGFILLRPDSPLVQLLVEDREHRSAYINLQLNAFHERGI